MTNKELGAMLRTLREESGISKCRMIKESVINSTTKL